MSVRQCLKARADVLELIDFAQDRRKRHGQTALSPLSESAIANAITMAERIIQKSGSVQDWVAV